MSAVIWGTTDEMGGTTGTGSTYGNSSNIWAYCERMTFAQNQSVKEVYDGDGVVRYRRNWGTKFRFEGTFIPVDWTVCTSLSALFASDVPIKMTDSDLGTLWMFIDSESHDKVAGESGPAAVRYHLSGWAYPLLVNGGI